MNWLRFSLVFFFACLMAMACDREVPPRARGLDASHPWDAAVSRYDGRVYYRDAARFDSSTVGPDASSVDSGADADVASTPVVDGQINEVEWAAGEVLRSSADGIRPFDLDALSALYVYRDATRLVLGVTGRLVAGHAIVVYVDADYGGTEGVVPPTPLADYVGALDRAITKPLFPEATIRIDYAWATLQFGDAPLQLRGWRNIGADPNNFSEVSDATHACSATACETAVPLDSLGVTRADTVGVFVRLVDADSDAVSTLTLPNEPADPEYVTTLLLIP